MEGEEEGEEGGEEARLAAGLGQSPETCSLVFWDTERVCERV